MLTDKKFPKDTLYVLQVFNPVTKKWRDKYKSNNLMFVLLYCTYNNLNTDRLSYRVVKRTKKVGEILGEYINRLDANSQGINDV